MGGKVSLLCLVEIVVKGEFALIKSEYFDLVYLSGCLVYIAINLMPNCGIGGYPNVDEIKEELLQSVQSNWRGSLVFLGSFFCDVLVILWERNLEMK